MDRSKRTGSRKSSVENLRSFVDMTESLTRISHMIESDSCTEVSDMTQSKQRTLEHPERWQDKPRGKCRFLNSVVNRQDAQSRRSSRATFAPGAAISSFQYIEVQDDVDENIFSARSVGIQSVRRTSFAHGVAGSDGKDWRDEPHDVSSTRSPIDTTSHFAESGSLAGYGVSGSRAGQRTLHAAGTVSYPKQRILEASQSPHRRDNRRSRTATNALQVVKDLTKSETEVERILQDRGKEINPRTGRISTATWMKHPVVGTKDLEVSQMHENSVVCKLLFSADGQRLLSVGKNGRVKIFRSNLQDLDRSPDQANDPLDVEFWEEEQEVEGHHQQCWSAALESSQSDFFITVGRDATIRVFSEGVLHGPLSESGLAPLQELRMVLGRRHECSTGTLEQVIARLQKVLRHEPKEARRLGILENPEQCKDLRRLWVCASEFKGAKEEFAKNLEKQDCLMQIFDCDLHPLSLDMPLLGTGWSNGDVRWYVGRKRERVQNNEKVTYHSWEWVQYQRLQDCKDAIFACKFSPDGFTFVTTSKDWTLCVYVYPRTGITWEVGQSFSRTLQSDAAFGRLESAESAGIEFCLVSRLPGHNGPVLGIGFHPSGETMASVGADKIGMLWTLTPDSAYDASPNSKMDMLIRGKVDVVASRKDVRKWNSLGFLCGHSDYVTACAFRSDGVLLATASRDCTVQLWRVPRRFATSRVSHHLFKCVDKLKCRSEVACLSFGRRACKSILWAGTFMGEVYSWDTEPRLHCASEILENEARLSLRHSALSLTNPLDGIVSAQHLRSASLRPGTTSDWSRMSTPHDLVPGLSADRAREPIDLSRFSVVDPWETRVCRAEALMVGVHKANSGPRFSMRSGFREQDEQLLDQALRLMHRTVLVVLKEEPLLAASIELDQSGLIAMVEACEDPLNPKECVAVLSKLVQKVLPIVTKGEILTQIPGIQRGRKNENTFLFRRFEVEQLLLGIDAGPRGAPPQASNMKIKALPQIEHNAHGLALAQSMVDTTPADAKKTLHQKFVQAISPQLSWQKDVGRAAQKVVHRLLIGLNSNVPLPNDDFNNYCCLLFNLNFLYHRVADIVQEIAKEKKSMGAEVLTIHPGPGAGKTSACVSFGAVEKEVDTLKRWNGLYDKPSVADRMQAALLPCNTPTWIGMIFSPCKQCTLRSFSVHVALGGGRRNVEPTKYVIPGVPEWEHVRGSGPGVAFCCKILLWDDKKSAPGHLLFEGQETYTNNRHFREYKFNLEDAGLHLESYEEAFIALTTEKCDSGSRRGYAWVSGIGNVKLQERVVPFELRKGAYSLAGRRVVGNGKLNEQWVAQPDVMACKVVYSATN